MSKRRIALAQGARHALGPLLRPIAGRRSCSSKRKSGRSQQRPPQTPPLARAEGGARDTFTAVAAPRDRSRGRDGDGLATFQELAPGTDPANPDTNGDGVPDGVDCFPLDATRSTCPPPVPGDTTPPVITLTEPTNAQLILST